MPLAKAEPDTAQIDVGDTVRVRSNSDWTHPSSPGSSPEVEPAIAAVPSSINVTQNHLLNLESPEPEDQLDQRQPSSRLQSDKISSKASPKPRQYAGTSEERLMLMPELRPLPWRDGVEPASENVAGGDSRRKQIRYGRLLATRGEIQKIPCITCANGRGKFSVCVALSDFFKGACASCQLSGGPNRCSIKQQDDQAKSPLVKVQKSVTQKRKSMESAQKDPSNTDQAQAKRRITAHNASLNIKWDTGPQLLPGTNSSIQDSRQNFQSPGPTTSQVVSGSVQQPQSINSNSNIYSSNQQQGPGRVALSGLPKVNERDQQHLAQSLPSPTSRSNPSHRPLSDSQTKSYHQQSDYQSPPVPSSSMDTPTASYRSAGARFGRDILIASESRITTIQDFPKTKQRRLYDLVSGIQCGIDDLQSQLDLLKNALGLKDEERNSATDQYL